MIPEKIGRYEVKAELGRGGMATVYHARDPRFRRDVAVKVLPEQFMHDEIFRARFEREAQIIAAIEHPGIVPVYDYGEDNGQPFLVMRYMTGGSLADRLQNGPLSLEETVKIINRLAPALDEMHARGIVHRDLKPANILFDQYGNAFISDFGIAHLAQTTTTLTGEAVLGTPAYMSPEQARGEDDLDGRSDIYAMGAIIFEMLTGKRPYEATTPLAVAMKHITEPVPDICQVKPDLPNECQALISKAMAKTKLKRYENVAELAKTLGSISSSSRQTEQEPGQIENSPRPADIEAEPAVQKLSQELKRSEPARTPPPSAPLPLKKKNSSRPIIFGIFGILLLIGVCSVPVVLAIGGKLFIQQPTPAATLHSEAAPTETADQPQPVDTQSVMVENTLAPDQPEMVKLFQDDFSNPESGWASWNDNGSIIDYHLGSYRIYVDKPNTVYWSTPEKIFRDVTIEVEAAKVGGPDDNVFGVICRYQDADNFYLLTISSDGYYGIGKYKNGAFSYLGTESMQYNANQAIHLGKTTNHIRADCINSTLILYANGIKLAQVEDHDFSSGDVGLVAAAFDAFGTDILFDNFIAKIP